MIPLTYALSLSLKSLKTAKLRTGLTALGIIIGIAAVVSIMTIGSSFQTYFEAQIIDSGSCYIQIEAKEKNLFYNNELQIVRNTKGVVEASPVYATRANITFMGETKQAYVIGAEENLKDIININMIEGDFISGTDIGSAIVAKKIAEETFKNTIHLRNMIKMDIYNKDTDSDVTYTFKVKGIEGREDQSIVSGMMEYNAVMIPIDTLQKATGENDFQSIIARAESFETMKETSKEIKEKLARGLGISQRDIDNDKNISFTVMDQGDVLDNTSLIINALQGIVAGVGAIALVVGSIGIMNIMLVTVVERTKEIGTMKALGYTKKDIIALFITESVVISLVGGIVGVIIGLFIAYALTSYMHIVFYVPKAAVIGGFFTSVVIGVVAGSYPAKRAADMNPVDALRKE